MPIHVDPEDLQNFGPEARAQIKEVLAAAKETAATSEAALSLPSARRRTGASSRGAHGFPERTVLLVLGGAGGAIALLVAGMLLGGVLRPAGMVPGSFAPPLSVGAAGRAGASRMSGGRGTASGSTGSAASTAKALRDARKAQFSADAAIAANNDAVRVLRRAQQAAEQVTALAKPNLAREPSARDPSTAMAPLQQAVAAVTADARKAQQAAAGVVTFAQAAHAIARTHAAAADAASRARASATVAEGAQNQAAAEQSKVGQLFRQAQAAVGLWNRVHAAPPGYLGIRFTDPTAGFGVSGCEIVAAVAGTPAAAAGLVGLSQRTDPMGDTISRIVDQTDGNTAWSITSCKDFAAAMLQTRAGDVLTIGYYHRQVTWYLFSGKWVPQTTQVTLVSSTCPPPVTGQVVDTRIRVTVQLTGPAGSETIPAIVDTGGANGWFDAGLLAQLGFKPEPGSSFNASGYLGAPPGTTGQMYRVPFPAILDQGRFVPLGKGTIAVQGIPGLASWAGSLGQAGLGPVELTQVHFENVGSTWEINWPSCGA